MPRDDNGDDAALARAMVSGDPAAFATTYERYASDVRALARRLVNDFHLAEDIVQEVFLRLWRRPDAFKPGRGSLRTYLLIRCQNVSIERLRADGARRRREHGEARTGRPRIDDANVIDLRMAVSRLPDQERSPIILAFFGDLTYRQVAITLGLPEGTTKARIRSGLLRLRDGFDP